MKPFVPEQGLGRIRRISMQENLRPRILITAGPTAEDIDPVRFICNRSTGRMGMEVAVAVREAGGTPRLILGPTNLTPPDGIDTVRVRSAADMHREVIAGLAWADGLVMTAAVADYTPAEPLTTKLKKQDGDLVLRLKRTVDILADVKSRPERTGMVVVGFSLDVDMNLDEGRRKLHDKNLDLIVVNTVSSFGSGRETAAILSRNGVTELGEIDKSALATQLVATMASLFNCNQE